MSISHPKMRCSTFFCCPSLFFELTSFLLRFLSFSSSSILLSRFGFYRTSSERFGVPGIYKFIAIYSVSNSDYSSCTLLRLLYSSLRPTWSPVQIVLAIPTFSILPSQDLMSTSFFKLILQNLKKDY